MKPRNLIRCGSRAVLPLATLLAAPAAHAAVSVDGTRSPGEGYGTPMIQATESNVGWAPGNVLANLSAVQTGGNLNVFVAGSAQGNAIILFIDSKPGGNNFIPTNLITSGGEEGTINNLGSSTSAGLTFEAGFGADYAVRIYGAGGDAYVNTYNFGAGARTYAGEAGGNNLSSGFISDIYVNWQPVAFVDYGTHGDGAEIALSLAGLGVPAGNQTVKLVAVLVNGNSDYASNQLLGSRTSATTDLGGGIKSFSFEAEPGVQTFPVAVDNSDNDGDGNPDATDPDDDNDGLPDTYENDSGTYVSATNTGSDPFIADTDGDSFSDGDEVDTSALGYLSDPNVPNYTEMTVPGSFNQPAAWTADYGANTPPTDMVQGATSSLTGQYQWTLDYQFTAAGGIDYKFAAGSWATNWGGGSPGTVVRGGGGNITATVNATGIHRFFFDQKALTHTFSRVTFANVGAFLTAYGLAADPTGDDDGDEISNQNEFAANTDPTNEDTDGDGLKDDVETDTGTYVDVTDTGTDPLLPDTDGDGLKDGVETKTGNYVDATDTGTHPLRVDSDSDGENDNVEIFHGTDPNNDASSSEGFGTPLVEGTRDALYGGALAVQTIETGFGDNGNEWNAAYGRIANGKLYLLFTGNLGDSFNKLEVFIDSKTGGSSTFASAGNDGSAAMNGMKFDAGFEPDFHLIARRGFDGTGKFDLDFASLGAPAAFTSYARVLGSANTGQGATGTGVNLKPILVAYNGSNTAGIGGNGGAAADQAAAAAVTTGLELCIDLADLGSPTGPLKVMLLQNNDNHSFLSNQSLAGLPVGSGNLGNPAIVDFSGLAGDQFFTVTPPAAGELRVTAVKYLEATDRLRLSLAGLEVGQAYKVYASPDLVLPFTEVAGSQFTAAAATHVIAVAVDPDTDRREFFKVIKLP